MYIDGILVKSAFGGNRFTFAKRDYRPVVNAIGPLPDYGPVGSEYALHNIHGPLLYGTDLPQAEIAQGLIGLIPHHGDFLDGKGG